MSIFLLALCLIALCSMLLFYFGQQHRVVSAQKFAGKVIELKVQNDTKTASQNPFGTEDKMSHYLESRRGNISRMNVVTLVLSARKDQERRDAIRESWAKGYKNVFFIVGDQACMIPPAQRTTEWSCKAKAVVPNNTQMLHAISVAEEDRSLLAEAVRDPQLILVPMVDYYRALPRKLKEAYRWALNHTDAHWFHKIDDDSVARVSMLEKFLISSFDYRKYVVVGVIRSGSEVPRGGKWAEPEYPPSIYPPFPNGAQGHVVSRVVAKAVVAHDGFEYQGEDVSLGIWLNEMRKNVTWVDSPYFVAHGNCHEKRHMSIGHDIQPSRMKECFPERRLHHTLVGRLGNQLFQWASTLGISESNHFVSCVRGGSLHLFFDGIGAGCSLSQPRLHISENGKYASYNSFELDQDVIIDGYLQSFKYFPPNLRERFRFKPFIQATANSFLQRFHGNTTVGIHVRHTHGKEEHVKYLRFPPKAYFQNAMSHFREKYAGVQFVVVSDDSEWCSDQTFFQHTDVFVITEKHDPAVDMAIMAKCDHMILTLGSFGWWAAFLGADLRGGTVVYYDSEFDMQHPINLDNVVPVDYYPHEWTKMTADAQRNRSDLIHLV